MRGPRWILPFVALAALLAFAPPFVVRLQAVAALRLEQPLTTGGVDALTAAATLTGTQAGDFLVALVRERDGRVLTGVSDTVNGSWTCHDGPTTVAHPSLCYFQNSGAGNPVVTITYTTNSQIRGVAASFSGVATAGGLDQNSTNTTGSGTSHAHASITPSGAALVLTLAACVSDGSPYTVSSGYTALTDPGGLRQYFQFKATHTGATTATFTSTGSTQCDTRIVAVLEAGGGGGATVPKMMLLGIGASE